MSWGIQGLSDQRELGVVLTTKDKGNIPDPVHSF